MKAWAVALILTAGSPLSLGEGNAATRWPIVQPVQEVFRIDDAEHTLVKTVIRDKMDNPVYLFICRTDKDRSVPSIVYAGDLDCRLMPARGGEAEDNLLIEVPGLSAWYSRGRMFAYELFGDCGAYPEYGLVRHFRLRGMKLTLEFLDVRFAPNGGAEGGDTSTRRLAAYSLRLTVTRDPAATRSIAAPSGFLDPSRKDQTPTRTCSRVQRGNEWGHK